MYEDDFKNLKTKTFNYLVFISNNDTQMQKYCYRYVCLLLHGVRILSCYIVITVFFFKCKFLDCSCRQNQFCKKKP